MTTTTIDPAALETILAFVDKIVPPGCTSVSLTDSRIRGDARPDSAWDVVAFHPAVAPDPRGLFKAGQIGPILYGGPIELGISHSSHWEDPRRYMAAANSCCVGRVVSRNLLGSGQRKLDQRFVLGR